MATDENEFESQESGSSLRKRLEETLKVNAEMSKKLSALEASGVINALGLTHVKPEDLAGVSASELEDKAREVEATKVAGLAESTKAYLRSVGIAEDQLDTALKSLGKPKISSSPDFSRLGTPTGTGMPEGLYGEAKLRWVMANRKP